VAYICKNTFCAAVRTHIRSLNWRFASCVMHVGGWGAWLGWAGFARPLEPYNVQPVLFQYVSSANLQQRTISCLCVILAVEHAGATFGLTVAALLGLGRAPSSSSSWVAWGSGSFSRGRGWVGFCACCVWRVLRGQ